MFFTARQLEQLHRENGGRVTLPYRARLTPAAQDWVRLKKIAIGYSDDGTKSPAAPGGTPSPTAASKSATAAVPVAAGTMLWWCDGPCGGAKAAITAQEKEAILRPLDLPADAKQIVPVIKAIAAELKTGGVSSAVIAVQNAAIAMVFANRCPSIRAVVGTCLEAVEQGIQQVGANVLVIEHPHKTFPQIKTMLARFARAKRELSPDVQRQLAELSSCG